MSRLCQLLLQPRDPGQVVARRWDDAARRERSVSWSEFHRDVSGLRARLEEEPPGAWLLLTEDGYAFAVGLFALWHSGRHATLPPNRQIRSLGILQQRAAGILSDRAEWFGEFRSLHPLNDRASGSGAELEPLRRSAAAVELYTSGTTGDEKPVGKRLHHLEDEVAELSRLWNETLYSQSSSRANGSGEPTVFATASHQHLYGLLFGVLWPLCSGRPFHAAPLLHVGELVPRMQAAGSCVLASVPTFLRRLARHAQADELREVCHTVFSSGGPLPTETAHAIAKRLGHAPVEVLGSTETGGIAWRTQEPSVVDTRWQPFGPVEVQRGAPDEVLRVVSPFVSVDARSDGFATGDRVELHADGRFELLGRADRVVKVGEKRLDLDKMASRLRRHALLDEVALTTLDLGSELRVAAAVVPSESGLDLLRLEGRRAFTSTLRACLTDDWDPVLQPRHWRVVQNLPENSQGKVTSEALRALFLSAPPDTVTDRPEILEEFQGHDFVERACRVPPALACFEGHFPDVPIVPGVLQLDWAMDAAALVLGHRPDVCEVETLKFVTPLGPGARFRLHVRLVTGPPEERVRQAAPQSATQATGKIEFRLWTGDTTLTTGRVRLRSGPGAKP